MIHQADPRIRIRRPGPPDPEGRCVLYWMQRAQRGRDNFALEHAIELGNQRKKPVIAVFGLTADYPAAQRRHYRFLVDALPVIRDQLAQRGVKFVVRIGSPDRVALEVAKEVGAAVVVGDENPVHPAQAWREHVTAELRVPFETVDADVVFPSALFPKDEWAARTLRIKMHKIWNDYWKSPRNAHARTAWPDDAPIASEPADPDALLEKLKVGGVGEVADYRGGPVEARKRLRRFLVDRLPHYATSRNEPTPYRTSELSAHLHFGHISPLTVALAVRESGESPENIDAYLEELIVRRELAINFVSRNSRYDSLNGCPDWALRTLAEHASDRRPFLYSASRLEAGDTHDPLWNAAQKEMVLTGRMHNYLRMYWAKKILEWSPDAATAFDVALDLNDRYEMDGRDPNGYEGIAWAIGGKHDRPWPERPIFGTVRFMSYNSTHKKFDSKAYITRVHAIESAQGH